VPQKSLRKRRGFFSSQKQSHHLLLWNVIYDGSNLNSISGQIIGLAMKVHRLMGPGLLESVYLTCLCYELQKAGLVVEREKIVPLYYEGVKLDQSFRLDLLVQQKIIVETKAIETISAIHKAQLLSYLKLSGCPLGLLINFNVKLLKEGICRMVNNFSEISEFATPST
jgi:GxxExxY protein